MKKLWISLMSLMASATLYALPLGNPWEASLYRNGIWCSGDCPSYWDTNSCWCDAWSVRIGFYGDFVFDKHMEVDTRESNANVHQTEINTQAAYLAVNFWERFDLFGTLGATNVKFSSPEKTFGDPGLSNYAYLETETDFSWSVGVRGTIWECNCWGLGASVQYLSARPNINFTREDGHALSYQPNGVFMKYQEWQVGVGLAYRINIICDTTALIPYAGVKFGRAVIKMDNLHVEADNETFFNLESDRDWGYALGATLLGCNKISVGAEVRFIDELAFYVNSQFRF